MAIVNPEKHTSAAQMLIKCNNGGGLTTPRSQVPALTSSPSPAIAAARRHRQGRRDTVNETLCGSRLRNIVLPFHTQKEHEISTMSKNIILKAYSHALVPPSKHFAL